MLASLIIIALVIPLITIGSVHSDEILLRIHYQYEYSHRYGSSDNTTSASEYYEVSAAVTLDNLSLALGGKEFRGYPVWVNVSNWSAGQTVQLAGEDFTVISPQERYGLYCWEAETYNGTSAYYHRETGVFLGSSYFETEFLVGTEWIWTSSDIIVTYQNLDDFHLVEYFFNPDALVLSFVLIETVVALKLFDRKSLMDSTPRKS